MNESDAISLVRRVLETVTKTDLSVEVGPETDLIEAGLLDSLDGMVFVLELEQATGKGFPDDVDLVAEGYYTMPKLLTFLAKD